MNHYENNVRPLSATFIISKVKLIVLSCSRKFLANKDACKENCRVTDAV